MNNQTTDPEQQACAASPLQPKQFADKWHTITSRQQTMATNSTTFDDAAAANQEEGVAPTRVDASFPSHSKDASSSSSFWSSTCVTSEVQALLHIALPTLTIQLGFVVPPFLTASYVGRYLGAVYLDGYQLAYLTINLCTLSLLAGLFSASDTLSPQAYGAGNFATVGVIAVRGIVASLVLIVPISVVLYYCTTDLLVVLGEDEEAAQYATAWYRTYCGAMPTYGLYMAAWKFLSAQNCMWPLVVASTVSIGVVLPVAMEWGVTRYGFTGSALAFALYQMSQVVTLGGILWYYQPYHKPCWPGLAAIWHQVFEDAQAYAHSLYLGMGGIVASSEWIYWEIVSLGIGTLGVVPLSVHSITSQFLSIAFMVSFGIGVSLSIRLGHVLPHNVRRAKYLVWGTTAISCTLFAAASAALYHYRTHVYHIFTHDPDVVAGCETIWSKLCWYFFFVSWFALNTGIANGLGMQWMLGKVTLLFLWCLGVPALWYYGLHVHQSLNVVWEWITPPYVLINLTLLVAFGRADWDEISMQIRKREGLTSMATERHLTQVDYMGPHGITYGSVEEAAQPLVVASERG